MQFSNFSGHPLAKIIVFNIKSSFIVSNHARDFSIAEIPIVSHKV